MYYLRCVCTTIDCNNDADIQRFTNYWNWASLSLDEQRQLVVLCYTFSPDVFEGKVFFQNAQLCIDANDFYEINQVSNQVIAARSIVVAGRTRRVNKIMAYKMSWLQSYYLGPMQRQAQRFSRSNRSGSCVVS